MDNNVSNNEPIFTNNQWIFVSFKDNNIFPTSSAKLHRSLRKLLGNNLILKLWIYKIKRHQDCKCHFIDERGRIVLFSSQ